MPHPYHLINQCSEAGRKEKPAHQGDNKGTVSHACKFLRSHSRRFHLALFIGGILPLWGKSEVKIQRLSPKPRASPHVVREPRFTLRCTSRRTSTSGRR